MDTLPRILSKFISPTHLGESTNVLICKFENSKIRNKIKKNKCPKFITLIPPFSSPSILICIFAHLLIFTFSFSTLQAQDSLKNYAFSGYISDLQNATFDSINKTWSTGNLIHNRLNFKYFPNEKISFNVEVRNRLVFGENVTSNPQSARNFEFDNGVVKLTRNIANGKSYVLNSAIDRLYFSYVYNNWLLTVGRQRINWGQTFVWNPNDIFNAYSFFDFDYTERPGSDAIRIQHFTTETSSTEVAVKWNHEKKITIAALYKFNLFEYDFQTFGGVLNNEDITGGLGWSGAIKNIAFRGEATWFQPKKKYVDTTGFLIASVGFDYSFSNSLSFIAEYLYNGNKIPDSFNLLEYYSAPLSVKNISFIRHSIFLQLSYPLTPLISTSISGMLMPGIKGYYIGPSVSFSLTQNIDWSVTMQSFGGEIKNIKERINMIYLRLKWNF